MYTIKVLSDQEFDKLPYKHVREALGCADPKTNTAYVRNVHWGEVSKTVNLLTIQHELDELLAKVSPHEEDGIRYKKGRDIFAPIGTAIGAMINPLLGMAMAGGYGAYKESKGETTWPQVGMNTALAGLGGLLARGSQAYQAGAQASKAVGGGWFGQGLSGTQSLLFGGSGAQRTLAQIGMPSATGMGSVSGTTPVWQRAGSAAGSNLLTSSASTGGKGATGSLDFLASPAAKLGLGLMGTSALPITPTPPQLGDIVSKWLTQDTVTRAGQRAQEIADVEYAGEWSPDKETQAFIEVMEKDIRKAYGQRAEDMDKMALAVNQNWMRSGERLEMMRRLNEEEQREVDNMKSQWLFNSKQTYAQRQFDYVMSRLEVDEQVKRDLLYGELADVMWKYQINQQDLMNLRQLAADAGMYLLQSAMPA